MTETRIPLAGVLLAGLAAGIAGLLVGLLLGIVVFPPRATNVDIADLRASTQDDYIILVSDAYAFDQDLALAKERLLKLADKDVKTRVGKLAKTYDTRDEVTSSRLASLAIALGAADSSLRVLAQSASASVQSIPTKFAQLRHPDPPTATNTPAYTNVPDATATPASTNTPKATATPSGPTATPKPKPTAVPPTAAVAPALNPNWTPGFADGWPKTAFFKPASVAPGQTYWRLVRATYCDGYSPAPGCDEMAGGPLGVSTYVMLLRPDGSRAEADMNVLFDNGNGAKIGSDIIDHKDPGDQCNCNYAWESSNYLVQVTGTSDAVGGLCLCSRAANFGSRSHVRYFFWFQQTVR